MGTTKIEWTATINSDGSVTPGKSWNPIRGCSRVSPGCVNCYAERQAARFAGPRGKMLNEDPPVREYGAFHGFVHIVNGHPAWTGKVELIDKHLDDPMGWRKPKRVFVNSMSDLFHENLPDEAIDRVFAVMAIVTQHQYLILTKRPERMLKYLADREDWIAQAVEARKWAPGVDWNAKDTPPLAQWPLPNVWLGVSVEDQQRADERIPLLLQTPAVVRFVSYEPALSAVDFEPYLQSCDQDLALDVDLERGWDCGLDWLIVGGESGPGARPFHIEWMRDVAKQCHQANVPVFCKQIGSNPYYGGYEMGRATIADRKGGDTEEWPINLRVREFPEVVRA